MKNYLLTSSTIAVLKSDKKTIIIDVDKIRVINKNIKKVIEDNCLWNEFLLAEMGGTGLLDRNILLLTPTT